MKKTMDLQGALKKTRGGGGGRLHDFLGALVRDFD